MEIWKEVKGCKEAALVPLLLGFLPSLWDVDSDYGYANTWDMDYRFNTTELEGNFSQGANDTRKKAEDVRKAYKNYSYLVICLPMGMMCLTSLHRGLSRLADLLCTGRLSHRQLPGLPPPAISISRSFSCSVSL